MNDVRRTILWVIFGFSLVLIWDKWQEHNGRPSMFSPRPAVTAEAPANGPADASIPQASTAFQQGGAGAVPGAAPVAAAAPRQKIEVTTDVYRLQFDTEGGALVRAELLQHAEKQDPAQPFVLFDESAQHVYVAQTGLVGGSNGLTHKAPLQWVEGAKTLEAGKDALTVQFASAVVDGMQLVKTYTLRRGAYDIEVTHEVRNEGAAAVAPQLYLQLVRDGSKAEENFFYSTFTGPAVYTDANKYKKISFEDIEKGKVELERQTDNGYVAMVQHYFASAWLLPEGTPREMFVRQLDRNLYSVGMITPLGSVEPGQTKRVSARLFAGPQEEKRLEAMAPGLELVKDYGWLTILAKPLYWLLDKIHGVLGNWGWSIVGLVLLLKIAFYWLNAKAYSSMAKMKTINPRIMELRQRLKDKPQQMQQEMMRIYREEKVNPMGGCLPIMVQIPVFIALYWVLLSSVEMRNAPWIGWISDLSTPDPYFILPLLMTVSSLFQTALNPAPPDPMQAKMMWIMPLIFSVMFFMFPAGLVLYWLTNNILSIAQQWLINVRMGVPPKLNLPNFKK